jgi:4-hydroxyphenylpyruvate dioxygenase-like putative hemolysin
MAAQNRKVLPPPSQLGVVVKDLSKAIEYYSQTFGLGPFHSFEFVPAKHWVKGVPTPIRLKLGKCQWGSLELELIEVVEGDIAHKRFLEENGEGMQHLGFFVNDYDDWVEHFKSKGVDVMMNAETYVEGEGHVRAAYMESDRVGGILFEIIEVTP